MKEKNKIKRVKQRRTLKSKSGITLIALVITVIILIILATVTLNVVLGEGGLIQRAQQAKELTEQAALEEQRELNSLMQEISNLMPDNDDTDYEPIEYKFDNVNIKIQCNDGVEIPEGFFAVTVNNQTDNAVVIEGVNDSEGNVYLTPIIINKPGTYTYIISQKNTGMNGYVIDESKYTLKINVEVQNGKLVASSEQLDIIFTNRYTAESISVNLACVLIVQGTEIEENKFEFELKNNNGETIDTAYNGENGSVEFKKLTFTTTGIYTYTISQINKGEAGYTYDDSVHRVEIEVTDDGAGKLMATVNFDGDAAIPVFINSYKVESQSYNGNQ